MTVMQGFDAVPVPVLDATVGNTEIMTRIALTFPQSLSLHRIEDAWYALVRAWPILAARIRPNRSTVSGLAYLVPQPATLDALEKRSRTSSKALDKHILLVDASTRPISSYHPIVGRSVKRGLSRTEVTVGTAPDRKEQDEMTCGNSCRSWKQLIKTDQAFVTAQATSWADSTTITIAFSHVLGDAFSIKTIFQSWQHSLQAQVPEALEGLGKDAFIDYLPPNGCNSVDKQGKPVGLPLGWRKFGWVNKLRFVSNLLWDMVVERPEKELEQFYIYMPEEKVQQLLAQARSDLEHLRTDEHGDIEKEAAGNTNVSTFNVLFAWLLQNIHATHSKPKKRSVVVSIVNAKTRPPSGHKPDDYPTHPLWGAAFAVPLKPLSCADYANLPLGQVALHIRQSLNQHIQPQNIQANLVTLLTHSSWKTPSGKFIFFARPNDYWCGCTEWRSVKFGSIDFGAAMDSEKGAHNTVTPVGIGTHMEIPMTQRNRWCILGDAGNGVWFTGGMTRKEVTNKNGFGRYAFVQ